MSWPPGPLPEQVQQFADDLGALLNGAFANVPNIEVVEVDPNYLVRPQGQTSDRGGVPLLIRGQHMATLRLHYRCHLDSRRVFMAVVSSEEWVVAEVDRTPLVRFDYRRDATKEPCSHIQVHAHRGALSHLLSQAGMENPHDMSYVRIPTGGARLRPSLPDIIQMLVTQIGVDALHDWEHAVVNARRSYREIQFRAIVRDQPEIAADVLRHLHYNVTLPQDGPPPAGPTSLITW